MKIDDFIKELKNRQKYHKNSNVLKDDEVIIVDNMGYEIDIISGIGYSSVTKEICVFVYSKKRDDEEIKRRNMELKRNNG